MKEVQEIYLELLKVAIWGGELMREGVKELTNERVNDVIRLAAFQGTGPLVFDQLLKLKNVEIPATLRMQMKQQCMMSMMQQSTMLPILAQACKALEDADIHPVLLKGFGLAQYYPQPHLRQWGDIDLYVGLQHYHTGCEVLRNVFPEAEHTEEELEEHKHYNFDFGNTILEMHRISMAFAHPSDRKYYERLEDKYLTKDGLKIELEGVTITVPEETFNVFFTFLHAWNHFFETGMNMKQVCDIAVLLHAKRDMINKERLKEMLTKLNLMEVWQLMMHIIVNHLFLSQEEAPFYSEACKERAELLLERILKEGSSRQVDQVNADGASYLRRKLITLELRIVDCRMVRPYAPKYAQHMMIGTLLHGIERTIRLK